MADADASPLRSAFSAWARVTLLARERFRDLVLAEGQRRYFALRRCVTLWRRWLPLKRAGTMVAARYRESQLRSSLARLSLLSRRRRSLRRSLECCARIALRSALQQWSAAGKRRVAARALSLVLERGLQRRAFTAWCMRASSSAALFALATVLGRAVRRAQLARGVGAFANAGALEARRAELQQLARSFAARHTPRWRGVRHWRSFCRARSQLDASRAAASRTQVQHSLRAVWRAWRKAFLGEHRSRANAYIAGAHYDATLSRRAFSALVVGVRIAIAERPVLMTCARIMKAWAVHVAERRHAAMRIHVAARRLRGVKLRYALRHWCSIAGSLRKRRDAIVVAMRHWRGALLCRAFAEWAKYHGQRQASKAELVDADVLYHRMLASRVLKSWAARRQVLAASHRADAFARAVALRRVFPAWHAYAVDACLRRATHARASHGLNGYRKRVAVLRWQSWQRRNARTHCAIAAALKGARRRTITTVWDAWRFMVQQLTQLRSCTERVQARLARASLRRSVAAWRLFSGEATGLGAARVALVAVRHRRLLGRAVQLWKAWSGTHKSVRKTSNDAVAAAVARLASRAARRAIDVWRKEATLRRVVAAQALRARQRAASFHVGAAFRALAEHAAWRRRRKAAMAAADHGNAVRVASAAWIAWRRAHILLQKRCALEIRALEHWERGILRRCFVAWKVWQQHRLALARHWVEGSSLRAALPLAQGGAHEPRACARLPPRGITGEVAAHLGRLELVAASSYDHRGSGDSGDCAGVASGVVADGPPFVPLLRLIEETQRLVQDAARGARLGSVQLASTPSPRHHSEVPEATRTKMAFVSGGALLGVESPKLVLKPSRLQPRPLPAEPIDISMVPVGSSFDSLPPDHTLQPTLGREPVPIARTPQAAIASLAVTRSWLTPREPPGIIQHSRNFFPSPSPRNNHAAGGDTPLCDEQAAFWATAVEDVQRRGVVLSSLATRIGVLEELLFARQRRASTQRPAAELQEDVDNARAAAELQFALDELRVSRDRLAGEQTKWLRAIGIARRQVPAEPMPS